MPTVMPKSSLAAQITGTDLVNAIIKDEMKFMMEQVVRTPLRPMRLSNDVVSRGPKMRPNSCNEAIHEDCSIVSVNSLVGLS